MDGTRKTVTLKVEGMSCQGCADAVARVVRAADPAAEVRVDVAAGRVEAQTNARPEALVAAIDSAGYQARIA